MLLAEKQKKKTKKAAKTGGYSSLAMGMDAGLCRPWCELACCSKPKHDIRTQEKVQLTHCTPPAAANIQFSNSQAANKNILKLQTAPAPPAPAGEVTRVRAVEQRLHHPSCYCLYCYCYVSTRAGSKPSRRLGLLLVESA